MLSQLKTNLLEARKRSLARRDWKVRYETVFSKHQHLSKPLSSQLESAYKQQWYSRHGAPELDTLRLCVNLSGVESPDYVPEEVFVTEIEPCLNRYESATFLANKSAYSKWFASTAFPSSYLHNIDGLFYSRDYCLLNQVQVAALLSQLRYPVVLKPTIESGGGRDVTFPGCVDELRRGMAARKNFVVQELISQHPFFSAMNSGKGKGINSLRVCVYRSVVDNAFHVLNVALRIGNVGTLDNDAAGGVACYVSEGGALNGYGVDKYGTRYEKHPASGLSFSAIEPIPAMEALRSFVLKLAADVWLVRLMSFDICMDAAGSWRVIEVNLRGQTIRFPQYGGHPFFGKFTREVIDYCLGARRSR